MTKLTLICVSLFLSFSAHGESLTSIATNDDDTSVDIEIYDEHAEKIFYLLAQTSDVRVLDGVVRQGYGASKIVQGNSIYCLKKLPTGEFPHGRYMCSTGVYRGGYFLKKLPGMTGVSSGGG